MYMSTILDIPDVSPRAKVKGFFFTIKQHVNSLIKGDVLNIFSVIRKWSHERVKRVNVRNRMMLRMIRCYKRERDTFPDHIDADNVYIKKMGLDASN